MNSYDGGHLKNGLNLISQGRQQSFRGGVVVVIDGIHCVVVLSEDRHRNYEDSSRLLPV